MKIVRVRAAGRTWTLSFIGAVIASVIFGGGLVVLVDPYDAIPFSPQWGRGAGNLRMPSGGTEAIRYALPALARRQSFDSAVVGNSVCQVFVPKTLNREFGGSFANLCLAGATFDEQTLAVRAFARHHTNPRTVIWALSLDACHAGPSPPHPVPFPTTLYDGSVAGTHLLFNGEAVRQATTQLMETHAIATVLLRHTDLPPSYAIDGEWNVETGYDLSAEATSKRIRGQAGTNHRNWYQGTPDLPFPRLRMVEAITAAFPADTLKLLVLMPVASHAIPVTGTRSLERMKTCKAELESIAGRMPNALFVDLLIASPFSDDDGNFVDAIHLRRAASDRVAAQIAALAARRNADEPP